jgi:DNA gyrase subunit A
MAKIAVDMMTDIDHETVDFVPEFRRHAPRTGRFAIQIPKPAGQRLVGHRVGWRPHSPHNLSEVIDAICYMIDNPNARWPTF